MVDSHPGYPHPTLLMCTSEISFTCNTDLRMKSPLDHEITHCNSLINFMCLLITSDLEHNVWDPLAGGSVSHGGVDQPVDEVFHGAILPAVMGCLSALGPIRNLVEKEESY